MRRLATVVTALSLSGCHIIAGFDDLEKIDGPDHVWSERAGDELSQQIDDVVLSPRDVRIGGAFEGTLDFDGQTVSTTAPTRFIGQLDGNGNHAWSLALDPTLTHHGLVTNTPYVTLSYGEAVSVAGLELAAGVGQRFAVVDIAEDGASASLVFAGEATVLTSVVVAPSNEADTLVMGASFTGELTFDQMMDCQPAITLDKDKGNIAVGVLENGTCKWLRSFGDTQSQIIDSVAADDGGNVIVSGRFQGDLDFGDGVSLTSTGGNDYFIVKLGPDGVADWAKSYGEVDEFQGPLELAVRSTGTISIAGYFEEDVDFGTGVLTATQGRDLFVAKLDPSGNTVWARHYAMDNASADDTPDQVIDDVALAVDNGGNTLLAGHFRGALDFHPTVRASDGDLDMFVFKLDADGELFWSAGFGDAEDQCTYVDCVTAMAIDKSNHVILGGGFYGSMNLGGDDLDSAGESDAFLVKLAP